MEEEKRNRGKSVDDGEDDHDDDREQIDGGSGERKVRKGTVRGATAKARLAIVSPAVGYRIEGGGLSDEDNNYSASSSSSATPATLIDDVFDLEGKDNDYKFYQTKFFNQGATSLPIHASPLSDELITCLCFAAQSTTPCCARIQRSGRAACHSSTTPPRDATARSCARHRFAMLALSLAALNARALRAQQLAADPLGVCEQGNRRMKVKEEDVKVAWWRKLLRMGPSLIEVAKTLDPTLPANLRHVRADDLPAKILTIEEKQVSVPPLTFEA
jgi:hypothetical protein